MKGKEWRRCEGMGNRIEWNNNYKNFFKTMYIQLFTDSLKKYRHSFLPIYTTH